MRFLFIFLAILMAPALVWAESTVSIDSERRNFGQVKQGEVLKHKFIVTNTGDTDLVISAVEPP